MKVVSMLVALLCAVTLSFAQAPNDQQQPAGGAPAAAPANPPADQKPMPEKPKKGKKAKAPKAAKAAKKAKKAKKDDMKKDEGAAPAMPK